jgi:hypothetical protein
MSRNLLSDAIQQAIAVAMDSASDRIVRLEAPRDWPISEAVRAYTKTKKDGVRLLITRPFKLSDFKGLNATDKAGKATAWRNTKGRSYEILVVGGKDGSLMAGLDALKRVPREVIFQAWRDSVMSELPADGDLGKPEVRRLITALFEQATNNRITASLLDKYLRKVMADGTVSCIQGSLGELGILKDSQILNEGMAARRLRRNLDLLDLLRTPDDQRLDARLKEAAGSTRGQPRKAAKAAIAYRQSGDLSLLVDTDLVDLEQCLTKAPPPATARTIGLTDVLDAYHEHPETVTDCLNELTTQWKHDEPVTSLDSQITIDESIYRVSVPLSPTIEDIDESDDSDGESDDESRLSFQWIGTDPESDVVAAMSSSPRPEGISNGQTLMSGAHLIALADDHEAVGTYLDARRRLRELEPWLENDAVTVSLLWPEAIADLSAFVDAWVALANSVLRDDVDPSFVEAIQALETVSGPSDENPSWVVLGPLHPYRLDPLVRAGNLTLARLKSAPDVARVGAALNWTLDKCYPAYPTIHRKSETYFNSAAAPLVVYEQKHTQYLPLAREYRGLDRTIRSLEAFSPPLARGLSVMVIDPPLGGAVCKALDTAQRRIAGRPVTVSHLATCDYSDNLENYDGDVQYLPKVSALTEVAAMPHVNILLRFVTGATSESEVTAADWGATRGAHLALQMTQAVHRLFQGEKKPQISIDPRQGNTVVRATHDLYAKASGKRPKVATLRPLFDYEEAPVLSRMASHTDWLVFAAPGPLGLVTPKTINNTLRFVGRHGCGRYGIYVYAADDMYPVRKHFEEFFKTTPIATMQPSQMVDLLVTKAHESGNAVLFTATSGAEAQVASLVALSVAKEGTRPSDQVFILNLDDLGWTSAWLTDRLRADFVLVIVHECGEIELRVVESKSVASGEQIVLDPAVEPSKEAIGQVQATMRAIEDICTASTPDLDQDLRFTSLIEHLMAAVMAALDEMPSDRRAHVIAAVNRFSRRESPAVNVTGRAIVTQSKVNASRSVRVLANNITLTWVGSPDVAKAFEVPVSQQLPAAPQEILVGQEGNNERVVLGNMREERGVGGAAPTDAAARTGRDAHFDSDIDSVIVHDRKPDEPSPPDALRDIRRIANDFIQAAKVHGIPVVATGPAYIQAGPTLFAIGVRLREGTTMRSLQNRASDIARDIGLGDKAHAIEVLNDAEPSTVKVLLPRNDRHFPLLPTAEHPSLLGPSGEYLPISIGQTIEGRDYQASAESWPHMLVAGSSGSGKTTFIKSLLRQCSFFGPGYVQTVVVDGKGETDYFGILSPSMFPSTFPAIQLGAQSAVPVLQWVIEEMEQRRQSVMRLTEAAAREGGVKAMDLFRVAIREKRMPPIVPLMVVIDEFAEIMLANKRAADEFEGLVQRISQVGRSRLIHLVLATQRPDRETIRGAIKANFPTRAVFRLPTAADSVSAIGHAGAEKLLAHGDMVFEHAGSGPVRLQGYKA